MSTEYQLYLDQADDLESATNDLYEKLLSLGGEVDKPKVFNDGNYVIGCWFAGISTQQMKKPKLEVLEEVYDITAGVGIYMQTYGAAIGHQRVHEDLMQLVDKYLQQDDRDLLLEFNGEFMIVLRKNGVVQINHAFDDGTRFPFHVLTVPYDIVQMQVS